MTEKKTDMSVWEVSVSFILTEEEEDHRCTLRVVASSVVNAMNAAMKNIRKDGVWLDGDYKFEELSDVEVVQVERKFVIDAIGE